ncbi:MAG: hypothetical protein EBV28_08165, partial [Betaproteobacteria bacterium]|nr:hypothetical protein [Betaproteobacteria bacterium]
MLLGPRLASAGLGPVLTGRSWMKPPGINSATTSCKLPGAQRHCEGSGNASKARGRPLRCPAGHSTEKAEPSLSITAC